MYRMSRSRCQKRERRFNLKVLLLLNRPEPFKKTIDEFRVDNRVDWQLLLKT